MSNIATRDDTTHPVVSLSVEVTEHAAARSNFKIALANFVREKIRKTWHSGHLTNKLYKSIVRKVVKKVVDKEKNIPDTSEKVNEYLRDFRGIINRFIKVSSPLHLLHYFFSPNVTVKFTNLNFTKLTMLSLHCVACRTILTTAISHLLSDMVLPGSKRLKRLMYHCTLGVKIGPS